MKATKIIALLMVTFIYRNAFSQSIFIKGFIRDARTGMALSNVSILNQTQYKKYITNLYGAFTINTQTGDSVLVTAIGYRPLSIIISAAQANDIQQWEIFQTPIKLKTFLYHYQNTDSIAELYARQIKSNSLLNDYQHIFNRPKGAPLKYMPLLIIFGGCTGCITSLWEKFAKRGKELNKFER
ncbi:MAG: hypothetical protein H7296_04080, partial [Bacteroidia bacterium]|nr:hypothetical protein [Bacteroidia bacterium]